MPFVLALVDAAQRGERAGAQARHFAHLLKELLGPIEKPGAQVILCKREQCLLAMLGRERLARQKILVDADGALDLAAAPIERAEREMRLDGVRIRIHELQEHVERPVGLLGDEIVETGEIVGMELAERPRPALAPAEMPRENSDDQRRQDQEPRQQRKVGHVAGAARGPRRRINRESADPHRR